MTWYEKVIAAHTAVTPNVSHGKRLKSERYFVWQEEGSRDLEANGKHVEKAVKGSTDLFTKREFDPWVEQFEQAMDRCGLAWYRSATLFEEETGFWHYEWVWGVRYGPDSN